MLKIQGIETWYGAIQALKGISLVRKQGEIVARSVANGAPGRATTIRVRSRHPESVKGEKSNLSWGKAHYRDWM